MINSWAKFGSWFHHWITTVQTDWQMISTVQDGRVFVINFVQQMEVEGTPFLFMSLVAVCTLKLDAI